MDLDFFPLKIYDHIHEDNALRLDWKEILPPSDNVRIMGNPPLDGYNWRHLKAQGFQTVFKRKKTASLLGCTYSTGLRSLS